MKCCRVQVLQKRVLKRKTDHMCISLGSPYIAFASTYLHSQSSSPLSKNMLWLQAVFIKQITLIPCYNILREGNKSEVQREENKQKPKKSTASCHHGQKATYSLSITD